MSSHTPLQPETQVSVHDTAKIKVLKGIVILMGVLLVVAFLTVIGTIAYRIMTKGQSPKSAATVPAITALENTATVDVEIIRPEGGTLINMEVEGQMMYLVYSQPSGGEIILVLDGQSGQVLRRITIK